MKWRYKMMRLSLRTVIRRAVCDKCGSRIALQLVKSKQTAIMSPILVALLFISLAIAAPPLIPSEQCTTDSECPSDFCCLLGPSRYAMPACMPYQQKGEQCRVNAKTITTNLTYPDNSQLEVKNINFILCSCADGLSCNKKTGICN
ncbi:uncharacterized protein [Linepithema humile]|uniref:uncharacterized protein n=1 Tax=Linepithema humile TaxID=83485 RepID=UPI00062358BB|nr:PREDICTED: astakine-like [Linepithema humile]